MRSGQQTVLRDYVTANQELAFTNKARVEAQYAAGTGEQETAEGVAEVDYQDFGDVVNSVTLKRY